MIKQNLAPTNDTIKNPISTITPLKIALQVNKPGFAD
jgi:hypothetical protein